MCFRGKVCSHVWINAVHAASWAPSTAGTAALSHQVPACGHPHVACFFPGFLRKDRLVRLKLGEDHIASARKAMIFMFCSPGAAGNACLNRKYCLYKSRLQHGVGRELLLRSNARKARWGGRCCLCLCCLLWGRAWGRGMGERRPLSCWGVEPVFDCVWIKGYVSLHAHWLCWNPWNLSRPQLAAQSQLIAGLTPANYGWNCLWNG